MIDQEISKVRRCLTIDARGVCDAIHRSESSALSMQDKRWAVESLALREAIGPNHNPAAMVDNQAHELLRKFLQSRVWRLVWDPGFISSKKLKQQKKGKQPRTS